MIAPLLGPPHDAPHQFADGARRGRHVVVGNGRAFDRTGHSGRARPGARDTSSIAGGVRHLATVIGKGRAESFRINSARSTIAMLNRVFHADQSSMEQGSCVNQTSRARQPRRCAP